MTTPHASDPATMPAPTHAMPRCSRPPCQMSHAPADLGDGSEDEQQE